MQVAYFLERLGYLRFDAEASRAKLYVDLQRMVNAGEQTRASELRRLARAKEAEIVTLDRLAEAVRGSPHRVVSPVLSGDRPPKGQRARMDDQVTR